MAKRVGGAGKLELRQRILEAAALGVDETAEQVGALGQEVTPLKWGALRDSEKIHSAERSFDPRGTRITAEITWGGDELEALTGFDYAAAQEQGYIEVGGERIEFENYTTEGTGAHFAEHSLIDVGMNKLAENVRDRVNDAIEGRPAKAIRTDLSGLA